MDARSDALFLSAVTVTEVCHGIARLERTGATAKAARLKDWLDIVFHLYGDRVIPFDITAARLSGKLMDKVRATGQSPGFADLAFADTVGSRDLTVLTRNVRHFAPLDIRILASNPRDVKKQNRFTLAAMASQCVWLSCRSIIANPVISEQPRRPPGPA